MEVQFQHVMLFIAELPRSAPVKIRLALLDYLTALIRGVPLHAEDVKNSTTTRLGITKIIIWSGSGGKFPLELRQASQKILVLLNQLNCREFVEILDTLEEEYRTTAIKMINTYPRRPSAGSIEEVGHEEYTFWLENEKLIMKRWKFVIRNLKFTGENITE